MSKQKALIIGALLLIVLWLVMLFFRQGQIEQDVRNSAQTALSEAGFSQIEISNSGQGRDLTLTGITRTQDELDAVVEMASEAYGVGDINSLGLEMKQFEPASFTIDFSKDEISISGVMQSQSIISVLSEAFRESGDGNFVNNLLANPDVEVPVWVQKLPELVKSLASLENGKLDIANDKATMSGLVRDQHTFDQLFSTMSQSLGDMKIDFSGFVIRPFEHSVLELYQSEQGLFVAGKVGSEQTHTQLVDAINRRFSNANVSGLEFNDDVEPSSWAGDAINLMESLSGLESPRLMISSEGGKISGIARTNEIIAEVESALSSFQNSEAMNSTVEYRPWQEPNLNIYFSEGAFSVSGQLPLGESSQKIIDGLGEVSTSIDDKSLELDEDTLNPEWLESALLGISAFQFLKQGELSIGNSGVSLKGVVETDREYESLVAAFEKTEAGRALIQNLGSNIDVILTDEMVCIRQINESLDYNTLEFETESADIRENSFDLLNTLVEIVNSCSNAAMEVSGHADYLGGENYNIDLSKRRANSVVDYMENSGVASDRLTAKGYGSSQPIADNNLSAGRAINRRVEINIIMTR